MQAGDNYYRIARRFGVSVQSNYTANRVTNPSLLAEGAVLIIPGVSGRVSVTPTPTQGAALIGWIARISQVWATRPHRRSLCGVCTIIWAQPLSRSATLAGRPNNPNPLTHVPPAATTARAEPMPTGDQAL